MALTQLENLILVNGEKLNSITALDRGFHYGDGLFETIAINQQKLLAFDLHLQRLHEGCDRLGINCPDDEVIYGECVSLARKQEKAVLKLVVSRGVGGRGYMPPENNEPSRVLMLFPWPDYPCSFESDGISAGICEARLSCNPMLAGIKHLNRLEQVLLKKEIAERYPEALVTDTEDRVIEGVMSNIFVVKEGELITPSLQTAGVNGVVRRAIIEFAPEIDINTRTADLYLDDVLNAEGLFFCNSLIGIWPARELPGKKYENFDTARRITDLLREKGVIATP